MSTKYYIALISEDGSTLKSRDYRGEWDSAAKARDFFCSKAGTEGSPIWWDGAIPYVIRGDNHGTQPLKLTRNELQRIRRRSPMQKAKEAAASRVSYWRKRFYDAPPFSQLENEELQRMEREEAQLGALRA